MTECTSELPTLREFIARMGVTMTATRCDRNPNMDREADMDHWRCVLRCQGRRVSLVFSKGFGHHGEPAKLREVLECIASEVFAVENARDFTDWCAEYGYDPDSRRAERIWKACQRQAKQLRTLLGSTAAYESLLWKTDMAEEG